MKDHLRGVACLCFLLSFPCVCFALAYSMTACSAPQRDASPPPAVVQHESRLNLQKEVAAIMQDLTIRAADGRFFTDEERKRMDIAMARAVNALADMRGAEGADAAYQATIVRDAIADLENYRELWEYRKQHLPEK